MKLLPLLAFLLSSQCLAQDQERYDLAAQALIDEIVFSSESETLETGLIHALCLLENPASDRALTQLAGYYLGEENEQALNACVLSRGSALLPFIETSLDAVFDCNVKHCVLEETRHETLDLWRKQIEGDRQNIPPSNGYE